MTVAETDCIISKFGNLPNTYKTNVLPGLPFSKDGTDFAKCVLLKETNDCIFCPVAPDCKLLDYPKNEDESPHLVNRKIKPIINLALALNGLRLSVLTLNNGCQLSPKDLNTFGRVESEISQYSNLILMPDSLLEDDLTTQTALALKESKFYFQQAPCECQNCGLECPIYTLEI
jgi:hypothetical protein